MKFISRLSAFFIGIFIFLSFSGADVNAVYLNSGTVIDLPKGKTFSETVIVGGNTLTIYSEVDGDLICAGQTVVISGDIHGDILCAAENLTINGNVDGSLRVAARNIEVSGVVKRNITSLSQNLTITKFSTVGGDIFFAGQLVDLRGSLGRDLLGAGEQISFTGMLGRDATMTASRIAITDPALIGGNLEYFADSESIVSVGTRNVKGKILPHEIVFDRPDKVEKTARTSFNLVGKIFTALSYLILGFALIYFLRKGVEDRIGFINKKPVVTALVGFATLILTPIAIIILLITVIGIPLAVVLLFEYIMSLIMATLYPSIILGEWIVKKLLHQKAPKLALALTAGVFTMAVLTAIPVLGMFIVFVAICLGLGSTFLSYLPSNKEK